MDKQQNKYKLEPLRIKLYEKVNNLSLPNEPEIYSSTILDLVLFFSNLRLDNKQLEKTYDCINNYVGVEDIESYLTITLNCLIDLFGEIKAKVIMMDTINNYINHPEEYKDINYTVSFLKKRLKDLMEFGFMCAICVTGAINKNPMNITYEYNHLYYVHMFEHWGNMEDSVLFGIAAVFENDSIHFINTYTVKSGKACIMIALSSLTKENKLLKVCANCNKFFIPYNRSDEIYCNNEYKNGKTCRELGYEIKVSNDPIKKAYRSAYKNKHAKMKRKTKNMSNELIKDFKIKFFDHWVKEANIKLNKAQASEITLEEFKEWLKK